MNQLFNSCTRTSVLGVLVAASVSVACLSARSSAQSTSSPAVSVTAAPIAITVDVTKNRHAINPLIYGTAYADDAAIRDLRLPVHRQGGNNTSRYNWQANADNRGSDWFFESIGDSSSVAGERADTFIKRSKANGAEPMITIPMIGYVAKLGTNRSKLWSFSTSKYGAQQQTDSWNPDAGNGKRKDGTPITGNNPLDANVAADANYQKPWVQSIVTKNGAARAGGLRYYLLDNEPGIWHGTHRDVHPVGAKMDEIRDKSVATAKMIKTIDGTAMVLGPEEWGWTGYFYSGYDSQWGNARGWSSLPDRTAHGGKDFAAWYLESMRAAEATAGKRLLDVFTLHIYPQGGEFSDNVSQAMQERRNRSTRSLFDPTYRDETWINDFVRLIPRMKSWVNAYYPGTKIGITEYNWGAEKHINGATAQADIFGIFGREGLDIGTRWTTPPTGSVSYNAMKLFRNYDGAANGFGETSVSATAVSSYDTVTTYAAERKDGAITIIIVNKGIAEAPVTRNFALRITGKSVATTGQIWQVGLAGAGAIQQKANVSLSGGVANLSLPAPSVTLVVFPAQ